MDKIEKSQNFKQLKTIRENIEKVLSQINQNEDLLADVVASQRSVNILCQLRQIGWPNVLEIDSDFSRITLACTTTFADQETQHLLQLKIPKNFPQDGPMCQDDFPKTFSLKNYTWSRSRQTLAETFATFVDRATSLIPVWQTLHELDIRTRVLDPSPACLNILYRRIFISEGVSLHISIRDEQDLAGLPQIQLLGQENKIKKLKHNLATKGDTYDPDASIVDNLERILGIDIPKPLDQSEEDAAADEDNNGECGICYNFILNGAPPSRSCDCGVQFHTECLYEWFRSTADNRQSLNVIFGKCPLCEKTISCPKV